MTHKYKVQKKDPLWFWMAEFRILEHATLYAIDLHDDDPAAKVRVIRGKRVLKLFNPQN